MPVVLESLKEGPRRRWQDNVKIDLVEVMEEC